MEKLNNSSEIIHYLKAGEILTSNSNDYYVFRNDKIHCYEDGNHFVLKEDDFIDLYQKVDFYIVEENMEIDLDKDEEYYRYYKK